MCEELIKALVKTQLELIPPAKDKINPRFKTGYSSLDAIYQACRIPLAKNGLTLSHSVETADGKTYLITTIYHISGQSMHNRIPIFVEQQTSQSFASALTYSRRYAVCAIIGLPTEEDDDGERAVSQETKVRQPGLSEKQAKEIKELVGSDEALMKRILGGYGVSILNQIKVVDFDEIILKLKKLKGMAA